MERNINLIGISGGKQMGKNTVADIIQQLTTPKRVPDENGFTPRSSYSEWKQKSFATKLKQVAELLTGVPYPKFESEEIKKSFMPDQWLREEGNTSELLTYRGFLQKLGTEVGRSLHPRIWEYALFADYTLRRVKVEDGDSEEYIDLYPKWIISDVRFPNEAEAIAERGGLHLRVFRPGHLKVFFRDPLAKGDDDMSGYYYVQSTFGDNWGITKDKEGKENTYLASIPNLEFEASDNHISERALDESWFYFDEMIINDGDLEKLTITVEKVLIKHKII